MEKLHSISFVHVPNFTSDKILEVEILPLKLRLFFFFFFLLLLALFIFGSKCHNSHEGVCMCKTQGVIWKVRERKREQLKEINTKIITSHKQIQFLIYSNSSLTKT